MMIRQFIVLLFVSALLLSSCGGDTKTKVPEAKDTITISTPQELKEINSSILSSPSNPDLYHKRAKYYLNNKMYEEGLADMNRAMNIDSSKTDYYLTQSDLYFATNKTSNAKAVLEKCIELDNKNVEALLKLAELYLYVNKSEKSIEYINKALKVDKYNAKAYFMKGMNFKDLKDTAKAISSMQTAVEQDQQYYNAYIQLGILSAAQKNKLAVDYYKNAIRIQPKSSEAWYDLGKFYQDVEDWNNAIGAYTTLLKFDNSKNAYYNLGVVYLIGLKSYNKAIENFTGAISVDPNYVEAYYGRGVCYQEMGDKKKAVGDFQACLRLDSQFQPAISAMKELK